jgi:hypothetical protein
MISPKQAHRVINIGFHMWILLTFLTIFFFLFISRKEEKAVTQELNNIINQSVPLVMDNIEDINQKLGNNMNWSYVNYVADNIEKKYENKPDPDIDIHNKKLMKISSTICVILLLIIIGSIIYFIVFKKMDIGLGSILIENFFISIFIGIIEAFFFLNVALKYSPVTSSDMINHIFDRTEYQINKQLEKKT